MDESCGYRFNDVSRIGCGGTRDGIMERPMTLMKSLLLGSAAVFAVAGAAQASDLLPTKKSAPAQYVKICTIDGMTGFTLPGSDTCLKISGHVHVELGPIGYSDRFVQGGGGGVAFAYVANPANTRNSFGWFTRARIQFDARSATAYGTLRSFASLDFKHTSDNGVPGGNGEGTGI
ncbi:MAG: porin, partial [Hyphomicrobiales bacterium]|nr:porin [Hyphomicrobiales bacterium]